MSISGAATSLRVRLVSVGSFSQGSSYLLPSLTRCIIGRHCETDDPTVTKLPLGIRDGIVSRQQLEIAVTATDEVHVRVYDTRAKTGIIFASGTRDLLSGEACLSGGDIIILDPASATSKRQPPEHFSYAYRVVVEPAEATAAPALLQGDRAPVAPVVPQGNGPASPAPPPIVPMEPDVAAPAPDAVPAPMATEPPAPDRQEAPPPIAPESDASEDALADAAEAAVAAGTPGAASVDSDDEELGSVFEAAGARLRGILLTGPVYTEEVYAAVQLEGTTYEERVASLWRVLKQNSRRRG